MSETAKDLQKWTKQEIVTEIARLVGVPAPPMSTGSTEPRKIFSEVNTQLGLGLDSELGKPRMAQGIAEAAGLVWGPDCESEGATVTKQGLVLVLIAVRHFVAD